MDPGKITQKLAELVTEYVGVSSDLPAAPGLVGTNTKYLGKISELIPSDPLKQAVANSWIHQIASVLPFLQAPEASQSLLSTLDTLLPASPLYALEEFGIVDLLITSIAIVTEVFNSIPLKYRKVIKYLNSLRAHKTVGKYIPVQTKPESKRNFNVVYGTGGRYRIDYLLRNPELIGQVVVVKGWAKTARVQGGGEFAFIELNDGSSVKNLQIVVGKEFKDFDRIKGTGFSASCKGLVIESPGNKQPIELQVSDVGLHSFEIFGDCEQTGYPLAKKNHTLEYLREQAHLRPRSNFIGSVARVRNALAFATHQFFNSRGFLYIHTPIITASDCEGAGEMFQVTGILGKNLKDIPVTPEGEVDYSKDFFGRPSYLTVSGQLAVENYACALSDVYTFGPTFRAENSHTSRHLAEFWMIEPELAWCDLEGNMECAESYLKHCLQYVLDNCYEDLLFFEERVEQGLINRLKNVLEKPFAKMTYTDALELIQKSGKAFTTLPNWGDDLQSEHERYVSEEVVKGPVIVYNYPKVLKSFYMKVNDDDKTVQAMDILVPKIGEVVGGSVREDRLDKLDGMIEFKGLSKESYWWYRQLRSYGTVPHAGFGLGFERLVMMATGVENIRDVIPFPRWPGHAEF
jgi:asparaginyl-tRNA synthetase